MKDRAADQYFSKLSEILSANKLSWVVASVNEVIRIGKLESKRLEVEDDIPDEQDVLVRSEKGRSSQKFTVSVDYTPQERLLLLVDGLRAATMDASKVELATAELIQRWSADLGKSESIEPVFEFYDDESGGMARSSDAETRKNLTRLCAKLEPLLKRLTEAIDAN